MRFTVLAIGVCVALGVAGACDDDNGGTTGAAGTTVQAAGTAGTTGSAGTGAAGAAGTTGAAGTGAAQTFQSLEPCLVESDYVAGTAITVSPTVIGYAPKCLKVAAGTTVTIGASTFHPLSGTDLGSGGNPIPQHQTANTAVSFPTAGFYSFQCDTHAIVGMKGVVWVTP